MQTQNIKGISAIQYQSCCATINIDESLYFKLDVYQDLKILYLYDEIGGEREFLAVDEDV